MTITDKVEGVTKRGPQSWAYIYVAFGFALALESTIIPMIEPLRWPCNLLAYLVIAAVTTWLFIFNGWFQNKLIWMKSRYEDKAR